MGYQTGGWGTRQGMWYQIRKMGYQVWGWGIRKEDGAPDRGMGYQKGNGVPYRVHSYLAPAPIWPTPTPHLASTPIWPYPRPPSDPTALLINPKGKTTLTKSQSPIFLLGWEVSRFSPTPFTSCAKFCCIFSSQTQHYMVPQAPGLAGTIKRRLRKLEVAEVDRSLKLTYVTEQSTPIGFMNYSKVRYCH